MKKKYWFDNIYILVLLLIMLLWIASVVESLHLFYQGDRADQRVLEPTERVEQADGSVVYRFSGIRWHDPDSSLMFYSNHQEVTLYCDAKEVFSRKKLDSIYGHTTGSSWNVVTIPNYTQNITVKFQPVYKQVTNVDVEFYKGDGSRMLIHKMQSGIINTVICLIIVAIGICLVVYWASVMSRGSHLPELFYLGVLSFLLGLWSFIETDMAQILIQNRTMGTFIGFSCIMLAGPAAILFAKYFFKTVDKYFYKIFAGYGILIAFVLTLLQALDVLDYREVAPVIQAVIVLGVIYWFYALASCCRRVVERRKAIVNLFGTVVLIGSIVIDLFSYYSDRSSANRSGKIGFLLYVLILGIETARHTKISLAEQRQFELYRQLATTDVLTGCYNRNAFSEDLKNIDKPEGIVVVAFDLNNLKLCNDSHGHAMGDEYLMRTARLLRNLFGKYGKIYRTGGDEFIAILKDRTEKEVRFLIDKMGVESQYLMEGDVQREFVCACGMAAFDSTLDKNLSSTLIRADASMYKNKKELKETIAVE